MWRKVLFLLNVVFVVFVAAESEEVSYLLPKTSVPSHYDVKLSILLSDNERAYNGSVSIDINIPKSTSTLVVHAQDFEVDADAITVSNSKRRYKVKSVHQNKENNFLTLKFENNVAPGSYILKFEHFRGILSNSAKGLFLSYYTLPNGERKNLVATHLEPINARTIFPCYDEPNLKATFTFTIFHPKKHSAVSNAPVHTVEKNGDALKTTFEKTEKLSTYLIALAVSDFETLEWSYKGKPIRLFVTPGNKEHTKFSLNATYQSLYYLEKVLEVPYTLPKLDSIAVPTFGFGGGMENWGLIVYSNSVVLKPNDNRQTQTLGLIAHEVAHQWFGNLVTLDWWDYVWLNEGFATYYAQRIADLIVPADNNTFMHRHYAARIVSLRRYEGSIAVSDNLNRHVEKPTELRSKFNTISYDKGSVIVRFMSLAFHNFDLGITDYLKKNSLGNTKPSDLFESISGRAYLPTGATVEKIMQGWTNNAGYPVVTLNITKNAKGRTIEFKQERFLVSGEKSSEKWWVPITLTTEEFPVFEVYPPTDWLRDQDKSVVMNTSNSDGWILANLQQLVYCRVNYNIDNWKKLIAYLKGPNAERIHVLNRIQLLDDCVYLAKAGRLPESIALEILRTVKYEQDDLVLNIAQSLFVVYAELLRETPLFNKYKNFVQDVLGPKRAQVVLNNEELERHVWNILNGINERPKGHDIIHELTERIYSEEKLKHVQKIFEQLSRGRNSENNLSMDLLGDVKDVVGLNIELKKRFFTYNYPEVKHWLDNNY